MLTVQESFSNARQWLLAGKYFKLLAAGLPVDIYLFGESSPTEVALGVTVGFHFKGDFDRVQIVANGAGDTVKFAVATDEAGYDALQTFTLQQPGHFNTVADVAVANGAQQILLAADGTRQVALITNPGPGAMRFGDVNTAAARGVSVGSGQTITIQGTAAIYAFNNGAAPQSVSISTINA